jgi:hypothetical protein
MTWSDLVPRIRQLTEQARPHYKLAMRLAADSAFSVVGLDLATGALYWKKAGAPTAASQDLLWSLPARLAAVPASSTFYFVKCATTRVGDLTRPAADFFSYQQHLLGGPNALTTTLVGSGLGALGGYGVGKLLDHTVTPALRTVMPKSQDDEEGLIGQSHWAPTLAALGAGVGAVPGVIRGGVALSNGYGVLDPYPWTKAAEDATGALFIPSIPVDAFNHAIWSSMAPNPFGTKSQWGDNTPSLSTPPEAAAFASGLVGAAGAARNQATVSPWDVARVATQVAISGGMGALAGATTGLLAGKVLGALAGLTPSGQEYAKRTGLWAGLLGGLASKFF